MITKQAADTHDDLGDVTSNILRDAGLEHDALLTKGLTRRAMLFGGGASLAAAVIISGQGTAWAQSTDDENWDTHN